jgi:hypothetical protein
MEEMDKPGRAPKPGQLEYPKMTDQYPATELNKAFL